MPHEPTEATPPPAVREAAAILISRHGVAALARAALSASRALRVRAPEEAAFWLCVCDVIRSARRASGEAFAAKARRSVTLH
jgi:hypothetical protein